MLLHKMSTDSFTGKTLQQLLQPAKTTVHTVQTFYLMFGILGLLILVSSTCDTSEEILSLCRNMTI